MIYNCIYIDFDYHNHINDSIILYQLKTDFIFNLMDNPIDINDFKSMNIDYQLFTDPETDSNLNEVYLVPDNLHSYIRNILFNNTYDAYLNGFFQALFHDYYKYIQSITSNELEPLSYEIIKDLYHTLEAIRYLYEKVFIHVYSQHESLNYPLLAYEGNYSSLFEQYYSFYYKKRINDYEKLLNDVFEDN